MTPVEKKWDTELAKCFGAKFGSLYSESVEYIDTLPTYALLRMRMALEELCNNLGSPAGSRLDQRIDGLLDAGKITFSVKDLLHSSRIKCNAALHQFDGGMTPKEGEAPPIESLLKVNAEKTRDYLIDALRQIYEKRPDSRRITVLRAKHDSQPAMAAMYLATTSSNAEDKFRAGQLCEAMAKSWQRSTSALIVSDDFAEHFNYLRSLAAMNFRSAYRITPTIDVQFRYAVLVEQGIVDGDKKADALAMIKASADANHAEACDYHGVLLWETEDYQGAQRYWQKAYKLGWPRACYLLSKLFESGKLGKTNFDSAVALAKEGAEQEDPDSLYQYGRFYYEGIGLQEDKAKGLELLSQAESMWCANARNYRLMNIENIAEQISSFGLSLIKQIEERLAAEKDAKTIRKLPRPGRNDPCPCGLGKKFKKCCGQYKHQPILPLQSPNSPALYYDQLKNLPV